MMRSAPRILLHGVRGFVLTLFGLCLSTARLSAQSAVAGTVSDSLSAIKLGDRIGRLDTLRVFGRPRAPDVSGFEERLRRNWFGQFVTAEKIEAMHVATLAMALATIPGLQMVGSEFGSRFVSSRRCIPSVYLDGFELHNGETAIGDIVAPSEVRGIEVYLQRGTAPLQFGRNECGAILVWTKQNQYREKPDQ
jgi:hypothetical protein